METNFVSSPDLAKLERKVRPFGDNFPGMESTKRARWLRILGRGELPHCYHVMSRLTDGIDYFDELEKQALVVLILKMARFCRIKVLTYCVMGNHFHALIEIPPQSKATQKFREGGWKPQGYFDSANSHDSSENSRIAGKNTDAFPIGIGWQRLLKHLKVLYSEAYIERLCKQLDRLAEQGNSKEIENIREAYLIRIADLSCYMREVKERFTKWLNERRGRRGTIWQGRFKSVLVQSHENSSMAEYSARMLNNASQTNQGSYLQALQTMAAYIDLNPVRAGLVNDPAEYPWCGYSAAIGGKREVCRGLEKILAAPADSWASDNLLQKYQKLLRDMGWCQASKAATQNDHPSSNQCVSSNHPAQSLATMVGKEPTKTVTPDQNAVSGKLKSWRSLSNGHILGQEDFVSELIKQYPSVFKRKLGTSEKSRGIRAKTIKNIRNEVFSARNCDP